MGRSGLIRVVWKTIVWCTGGRQKASDYTFGWDHTEPRRVPIVRGSLFGHDHVRTRRAIVTWITRARGPLLRPSDTGERCYTPLCHAITIGRVQFGIPDESNMTVIQKILRLDHPGVLRDFSWTAEMPAFGRFNLIYGWNGSGKTTISRILRNLERGKPPADTRVTLSIRGRNISEAEFSEPPIQVRTFNSDFVNETVFRVDAQEMPPIFVVGKDSVEKQQKLDGLRTEQSQKAGDLQLASINSGES